MPNEKELLEEIRLLKEEIKKIKPKKYGLVWEEKPEKVAKLCKDKLPIFQEDTKKEIITAEDKPVNILIEGDNYHALSTLNYTHNGSVDLIYIDPPYNTGNKDFIYNDNYVDREDTYRHSKWLSFMHKRLILAKNLLKRDGVIFINIDHNEVAQLKLLCDEVFGEQNFQREIVWRIGWLSGFKTLAPNFIRNHDTILMYSKSHLHFEFNKEYIENKDFKSILKPNERVREKLLALGLNKSQQAELLKFINYENRPKRYPLEDTWNCNEYDDLNSIAIVSFSGEKVSKYLGTDEFDGQKPIKLIKRILKSRKDKSAIVLDFFAGSGTTGHAVLDLNKEDGGNRKFILCTNDDEIVKGEEYKIMSDVCYPRIKKVIKQELGGNLKYYKTDFVDAEPTDRNKKSLVDKSTEMLCLKEDCFESVKKGSNFKIFKNNGGKYLGIIYDDAGIASFKKEAEKIGKKFIVYVFSLDDSAREEEFEDIKKLVELKPIPAVILNVYKRIFK